MVVKYLYVCKYEKLKMRQFYVELFNITLNYKYWQKNFKISSITWFSL